MLTKNSTSWGRLLKTKKESCLDKSKYLNLPDLQFFKWCNQQYGLNKGVYNTIDNWLYEYGIEYILSRRIYLLAFLEFSKSEEELNQDQSKFIRFGHGGLVKKLHEFIRE